MTPIEKQLREKSIEEGFKMWQWSLSMPLFPLLDVVQVLVAHGHDAAGERDGVALAARVRLDAQPRGARSHRPPAAPEPLAVDHQHRITVSRSAPVHWNTISATSTRSLGLGTADV